MNKLKRYQRRKRSVRSKLTGTEKRPRMTVHRTLKYIYAQLIDDVAQKTILAVKDIDLPKAEQKKTKTERAEALGIEVAKQAKKKKIYSVVFDRGGYAYKGRVKAVAEGARKGGLKI